ncbi:MAG: hypothetical protein AAF591_18320 [Verrucomicrobiota bacterium]
MSDVEQTLMFALPATAIGVVLNFLFGSRKKWISCSVGALMGFGSSIFFSVAGTVMSSGPDKSNEVLAGTIPTSVAVGAGLGFLLSFIKRDQSNEKRGGGG